MKKQELKEQLHLAYIENALLIDRVSWFEAELNDTKEALRRRRILYDRLANHSTIQKPKSMNEMAASLYDMYWLKSLYTPTYNELPDNEKDEWMDRLLTILN